MKPGVHEMSEAEYRGDPCEAPSLNASIAKVLIDEDSTPAHARLEHPRLNPRRVEDNDPKYRAGKILHSLFLEGDDRMAVFSGLNGKGELATAWQTNESKAFKADAYARGLIPVLVHEAAEFRDTLAAMRARIRRITDRPEPFTTGKPEQTLIWQEDNGVWCRARLDWLRDDGATIDDLKIVASASPGDGLGAFGRNVENLGHYVQAEFYRRGARKALGIDPVFRFVCLELGGPGKSCVSLNPAYQAIGEVAVSRAIALWGDCLKRNDWPDYPDFRVQIEPSPRLLARFEMLQAEENLF